MKEIPTTHNKIILVDDEDYNLLSQFTWYAVKTRKEETDVWYAYTYYKNLSGQQSGISMHTMLLKPNKGFIVDHADRNGLNNQKFNLRRCTISQNGMNSKLSSRNSTGYKGVDLQYGKYYRARIVINKKRKHLGMFGNAIDAALAYDNAAIINYGEYARLNFPIGK